MIDEVIANIPTSSQYCLAHHDDIIVVTTDKKSHKKHLQELFKALISQGLKILPKKCSLFQTSVHYTGHLFSIKDKGEACIKPLNDRCAAVRNTPVPHYICAFFSNAQAILLPLYTMGRYENILNGNPNINKLSIK